MLDGGHALLHGEAQAQRRRGRGRRRTCRRGRPPRRRRGSPRGCRRCAWSVVPASWTPRRWRRASRGRRRVLEVLAHAAADLVHAVEAQSARPWPLLAVMPRVAQRSRGPGITPASIASRTSHVEEVLLGHDAHRGGAGGEVAAEVGGGAAAPGAPAGWRSWPIWSPSAGHDGDVAVGVDEPGHHEAVAEVEDARRRRGRASVAAGPAAAMRPSSTTSTASRDGVGAGAVEEGAAADGAHGAHGDRRPRPRRGGAVVAARGLRRDVALATSRRTASGSRSAGGP